MYVSEEFYYEHREELGLSELGEDIKSCLKLAEIKVDSLTFGRIRKKGFDNLSEFQKQRVREAVCCQAQFISENGFDEADVSNYSVLNISVTVSGEKSQAQRLSVSPVALSLLRETGLMFRGC